MTELEDLIEKSTINLGITGFTDLSDVENLLRYIAERLPGRIDYKASYRKNLSSSPKEASEGEKGLDGGISRIGKDYEFTFFSMTYELSNRRFTEIKFQTIPGYSLEEHRPGERQLWGDVRGVVEEYIQKYIKISH